MCVSLCISHGKNLWTTVDGHWCGMPVHRDIVCVDFEGPADRSEFIVTCCWSGWCDDLLADSAVPWAYAYSWKHYNDCTNMPYSFILFFILYTLHLLLFCLCTFCFCNPFFVFYMLFYCFVLMNVAGEKYEACRCCWLWISQMGIRFVQQWSPVIATSFLTVL